MTIPTSAINRLAIIAAKESAQRARALEAEAQQLREDAFRSLNYPRPFGLPWGGSDRALSGKVNLATEKLTAEIVLRGANEYGRPEESVLGSPKLSVSVSVGDDSGFRYMTTLPAPTDLGIDDVEQRSTTTDGTAAYVLPAERGPEFAAALAAALQRKSITID